MGELNFKDKNISEEDLEFILKNNKNLFKSNLIDILNSREIPEHILWAVMEQQNCDDDVLDLILDRPIGTADLWGKVSESYKDFNKERMDRIWHKKIYPEKHCDYILIERKKSYNTGRDFKIQ